MERQQISEINIDDTIADTKLEVTEIDSILKILCYAMENFKNTELDLDDFENVFFMLQGKMKMIKNNLSIIQQNFTAG